jgi:hypothetical protein
MGRVIYVDGPEKAGKTTFIAALKAGLERNGVQVHVRRWGAVKPDDRVYAQPLESDLSRSTVGVTIWDRGWASEAVYGKLLNRQRRGANNPWILEWLHGRAVVGNGLRIIYLPNNTMHSIQFRDDTDLPVDPYSEYYEYLAYARRFKYHIVTNDYDADSLKHNVNAVIDLLPEDSALHPKYFTNDRESLIAPRLIIGEARNKNDFKTMAGAWLPFSSARMCAFVQKYFGDEAFDFAWTNVEDIEHGLVPLRRIKGAAEKFAFGEKAKAFCTANSIALDSAFAHPGYFARWNTERGRTELARFESQYKEAFDLD